MDSEEEEESGGGDDPDELNGLARVLPIPSRDDLWQAIAPLMYTQHGGSGLGLALCDIMELDLDRVRWLNEWQSETREAEAAAIQKAGKP